MAPKSFLRAFASTVLVSTFLVFPGKSEAAVTSLSLEFNTGTYGTPDKVLLGSLSSRSASTSTVAKNLSKSTGSAPYTMTGTDSLSGQTYQYQTMQNYVSSANLKESIDVTSVQTNINPAVQDNQTTSGSLSSRSGVFKLSNSLGNIGYSGGNNSTSGVYGAVFGPEIWSSPFEGSVGKSVSFDWAAAGGGDDYEIYAFLVKISSDSGATCTSSSGAGSYGLTNPTTTHNLLAYGRGTIQDWITAAGAIPSNGCYRFRFVSGTYDKTGGLAVGAALYIDNTVILGDTQTITFAQPNDYLTDASDQTFSAGATTNASGATLTYSSSTTSICTVDSSGIITRKANQTGTCTITVNSGSYGDYAAATPVTRSFSILASATAPSGQGTSYISGVAETCATLTANIGTWNDGGDTITATSYQWKSSATSGGTYSDISGSTSSTYTTTSNDLTKYLKVTISRTNSQGTGSETTAGLLISTAGVGCASSTTTPTTLLSSLVTFAQNGADNNSFPQSEILGETKNLWRNVLTREGYTFTGWNTKADGSGTSYADQASFKFDTPYITLYAQWKLITSKPTLTWITPAAVNEGTTLSSTQLNATASVSGTFTYSPPSGTVLKRGNQVLKVTFVPNEAKYETVETTVVLQVLALPLSLVPATQVVSGVTGLAITPTSGISGVNFTSAPITYSVVGGSLPAGLTLNSSTGAISGTPTISVNGLVITIQAQNSAGETSTATITFNIAAAPQVEWVTKQIDSPTVGKEYSFQLVANNANVYSIMSGNLPQGLTLDSATGLITGKATKAGKFNVQILANNMYNTGQALQFEISVVTAANQTSGNQNINMKPESAGVIAFAFKSFNLDSKNRAVVKQLNLSKAKVITIYGYASNNRTSDDIRISLDRAITVRKELQRLYPKLKINNLGLGTKQIAACKTVLNRCAIVVVNR